MRLLATGLLMAWAAAGQSAVQAEWRTVPLVVNGKLDAGWKHVGWGGFVVNPGRRTHTGRLAWNGTSRIYAGEIRRLPDSNRLSK